MTQTTVHPVAAPAATELRRARVTVRGLVQGVGYRPFVALLAERCGVTGWCANTATSVEVEAQGGAPEVERFVAALRDGHPPLAVVYGTEVGAAPVVVDETAFTIVTSEDTAGARTLIGPDVAVCGDCLREMGDSADRRYRHPFITCTNCGPRYTIIEDLPYDRATTTMREFPLCSACRSEYEDPTNRRFHAQPVSCHDCGPTLELVTAAGTGGPTRAAALDGAARLVREGGILAVKGLGGFHLAARADLDATVARLRERKRRPAKPFALMVDSLETAARLVVLSDAARAALAGPAAPIVVAPRRPERSGHANRPEHPRVCDLVAPECDELGIMLAYTPLHHLLLSASGLQVLIMTSANHAEEPIATTNAQAQRLLVGVVEAVLQHDREIVAPCEDTVLLSDAEGGLAPLRRSRGLAPLPVALPVAALTEPVREPVSEPVTEPVSEPVSEPVVFAVGAELKNTFALARDGYAFLSPHLGDMHTLEAQAVHAAQAARALAVHNVTPRLVVSDLHPLYSTGGLAERYADEWGAEHVRVQHHHAHALSLAAEHDLLGHLHAGGALAALTFDGTGFGCDRQIWGGELLLCTGESADRLGHLAPLTLAGGDAAVRHTAKLALAVTEELGVPTPPGVTAYLDAHGGCSLARGQLAAGLQCVRTTSAGRLFDAAGSVLNLCHEATFEGQGAIALEAAARRALSGRDAAWALAEVERPGGEAGRVAGQAAPVYAPALLPWEAIMRHLVAESSAAPLTAALQGRLALSFHVWLGEAAADLVARVGVPREVPVGLTGGVFANRVLTAVCRLHLQRLGYRVLTHRAVPANDGGLALGQVAYGVLRRTRKESACA
ncbi:carbamoyltransferase HypF [Micrococcales bacterium 31B]|nr:carbamoyltransferase HypF [Micrococcales bacterium 31B]